MKKRNFINIITACLLTFLLFPCLGRAENVKIRVVLENANIRLKPDLTSTIIEIAPIGAILESDGQIGDWFRVNLPPNEKGFVVTGYVHNSMIQVIRENQNTNRAANSQHISYQSNNSRQTPIYTGDQPHSGSGMGLSIKFYGGMGYLHLLNDLNDGLQGIFDIRNDDPDWEVTNGTYKPLHWELDFGGEIIINLTSQFGLGFGAGYILATKESTWDTSDGGMEDTYTTKPKIRIIPLTASLHLSTSDKNAVRLTLNGGVGYYLATINWHYLYSTGVQDYLFSDRRTWEAKSKTIGFHGGLGFEFKLANSFAFVIEGVGRYVKLKDLAGDFVKTYIEDIEGSVDEDLVAQEEETTFWHADYEYSFTGNTHPWTIFSKYKPSSSSYKNVRKGIIDLSGFSIRTGFRIRF